MPWEAQGAGERGSQMKSCCDKASRDEERRATGRHTALGQEQATATVPTTLRQQTGSKGVLVVTVTHSEAFQETVHLLLPDEVHLHTDNSEGNRNSALRQHQRTQHCSNRFVQLTGGGCTLCSPPHAALCSLPPPHLVHHDAVRERNLLHGLVHCRDSGACGGGSSGCAVRLVQVARDVLGVHEGDDAVQAQRLRQLVLEVEGLHDGGGVRQTWEEGDPQTWIHRLLRASHAGATSMKIR